MTPFRRIGRRARLASCLLFAFLDFASRQRQQAPPAAAKFSIIARLHDEQAACGDGATALWLYHFTLAGFISTL